MSIIRRGLTLAWNKTPPDDPAIGQATERPGLWPDSNLLRLSPFPTLLIGPPSLTSLLLDAMRPSFRLPVVEEVVEIASLPHEGTVILRNVESLDEPRQSELSAWIASSAARLVTVCGGPLYPRVAEGSFSSELYYRLNTVTLVENGQGGIDAQAVRRTPHHDRSPATTMCRRCCETLPKTSPVARTSCSNSVAASMVATGTTGCRLNGSGGGPTPRRLPSTSDVLFVRL